MARPVTLAALDWSNLSHATAFLLGATLATAATLRIVRSVTNFFASVRRDAGGGTGGTSTDQPPPGPPTGQGAVDPDQDPDWRP